MLGTRGKALGVIAVAVISGCGVADSSDTKRWVDEVALVNGSFMEVASEGKRRIARARTASELTTAYSTYAVKLKQHLGEFEEIKPPGDCADEQAAMERFMRQSVEFAELLADQDNLTPVRLEALEQRQLKARDGMVRAVRPTLSKNTC